jgi:hypothetical protein
MAGRGKIFSFHGAFKTKRAAKRKERAGEFIHPAKIKGKKRFLLLERLK